MASRKVLVPIKRVLDYAVKVRVKPDHTGVDLSNSKMSMNPFCEIAVEEALRLRERNQAAEVIVISIGPKKVADTLRVALSMGADRAIHVLQDDAAEELQPLALANVLRVVVQNEEPHLVILGKQSIDGDNNQTGQMLAGMLDWPQATFASKVDTPQGDEIEVTREIDGGLENVTLKLPAVVTCDLRLNEPRFVKLSNVMKAKKKKIETIDVSSFDLDLAPRIDILSVTEPPKRTAGVMVSSVDELVEKLRSAKVL